MKEISIFGQLLDRDRSCELHSAHVALVQIASRLIDGDSAVCCIPPTGKDLVLKLIYWQLMALQMLKETKGTISGMHRLPSQSPGSPSRRAASGSTSGIAFKSKLLAALDAELDALQAEAMNVGLSKSTEASVQAKSSKLVSKPLEPSTSSSTLQSVITNIFMHGA